MSNSGELAVERRGDEPAASIPVRGVDVPLIESLIAGSPEEDAGDGGSLGDALRAGAVSDDLPPAPRAARVHGETDRWAHRRAEPRPWALMWTGYLLLATLASLGTIHATRYLSPDIYRPAAVLLLAAAAFGVAVFWPMIRLSQSIDTTSVAGSAKAALLDCAAIVFPLHLTIWPQSMPALSNWDLSIAAVTAAHATAWLAVTGAMLALAIDHIGRAERAGERVPVRRAGWMLLILSMCLAGPAVLVVWSLAAPPVGEREAMWLVLASPVTAVFEITKDRSWMGRAAVVQPEHWRACIGLAILAAGLWLIVLARWLGSRASGGSQRVVEPPVGHGTGDLAVSGGEPGGVVGVVVKPDRAAFN